MIGKRTSSLPCHRLGSLTYFYLEPTHVHLCQIPSNGPCLCLSAHHLQKRTLQEEKDDTDEHTDRITAVRSQIQADREIDQRTEKDCDT